MSALPELFPRFEARTFTTGSAEIFARLGGDGPPLLLLHGYPQTHAMWHRLAPKLAKHFSLVIADLRGYGESSVPTSDEEHYTYSKRAMGGDMVEVMSQLGHDRFAVLAHDRGARVGYRLAFDHPGRVARLALLDIVPTYFVWQETARIALGKFHWPFLAQPAPVPETIIGKDPAFWHEHLMASWNARGDLSVFSGEALSHYRANFTAPERIHAMCEDYRAGATYDLAADRADHEAGNRIACPVLALWGQGRKAGFVDNSLDVWREWCDDVQGAGVDCGHFLAEENPEDTLHHLSPFLHEE